MNLLSNIQENKSLLATIIILGIVLIVLAIIVFVYLFIVLRKISIMAKKISYFYEDIAYKSEMLNSTVETTAKVSNYIDIFESFAKRNIKSWAKIATQNKDFVYKMIDKLRDFSESDKKDVKED